MSESKHAPGPWVECERSIRKRGCCIAIMPNVIRRRNESDDSWGGRLRTMSANRRLIAAAPDLLAACEAALAWLEKIERESGIASDHTAAMLRIAIAKA